MDKPRKVIIFIAASLDGFIAQSDGDISFLEAVERPSEDYGYGYSTTAMNLRTEQ